MLADLSHTLKTGMPVFPGDMPPGISAVEKYGYRETILHITTHTGTHIDCPGHVFVNAGNTSGMVLEMFYGKGLVIDCKDTGNEIQPALLQNMSGAIGNVDFVLFYTGWDRYWDSEAYFRDYPILSKDATEYLLTWPLKGIGFDTCSADPVDSAGMINHKLILGKGLIIIENLTNLKLLAGRDFYFSCFPLRIQAGDGSPVRAVAYVNN